MFEFCGDDGKGLSLLIWQLGYSLIWCLDFVVMEEQFILRVPPSVAERIDRLLSENASSPEDKALDLSFSGENLLFVLVEVSMRFSNLRVSIVLYLSI